MRYSRLSVSVCGLLVSCVTTSASAQVQIRLADSTHATYSELHEALRLGTPDADSVRAIMGATSSVPLWARVRAAIAGRTDWTVGLLALTRIAELREAASVARARQLRRELSAGKLSTPPGIDPADLIPPLHAIELEQSRTTRSDLALLAELLARIPSGAYDLGDAWVFGRLGQGAADTIARRLTETSDPALRIRYLTLLSFSRDTTLIPLLARIYVAPDSLGLPLRIAVRASDGLLWIGTRRSLQALLDARTAARARGIYDDPRLRHAELDFLGSDSSAVISRTGRWLTEWLEGMKE